MLHRIAAITPELLIADTEFNVNKIINCIESAYKNGASIHLFPELCITGYTCGDLFYQKLLLEEAENALDKLLKITSSLQIVVIVGLPLSHAGRIYNCAVVLGDGKVYGVVPKQFLPNYGEYYEQRWFTSGYGLNSQNIILGGDLVPFGPDLLFENKASGVVFGIEICEDLWSVKPPSADLSLAGAELILNSSASNESLGKAAYRRDLVRQQSARCHAAYAYAASGPGESSTDLVFSGHCLIAENGVIIAESERFCFESRIIMADIDLEQMQHERLRNSSFTQLSSQYSYRCIPVSLNGLADVVDYGSKRPNSPHPFVPSDLKLRSENCEEIFAIQSTGLAKRLRHIGDARAVLGISGGLDSTLALLATMQAFDLLGLEPKGIIAVTMPGFGTTNRTRGNAERLVELLGTSLRVIPISEAVIQHFKDIDHDSSLYDVTYENAQARERTQILMDLANQENGIVVGTGDLSEAALGWCTFNGDHMSMYHVNIGVPKTLVRYIIEWCAETRYEGEVREILYDIINTPITPELLPVDDTGHQAQQTESTIGPYELHDFFLYHMVRHGSRPSKVLSLAEQAFSGSYDRVILLRWLEVFFRRFFSQQFKRSAMPDGPKIGSVALSPRGDWRMPSDASVAVWQHEIDSLKKSKIKRNYVD
jgi:NAD+ synthase (glutamine-hydrolysing)